MFNRNRQNQQIVEQKQRYAEQEQQAELAQAALFTEVDRLQEICSLLLASRQNRCIHRDDMRYNMTRLHHDGPTRLLIADGQRFVDYSFTKDFINITAGERRIGQQPTSTSEYNTYRNKLLVNATTEQITYAAHLAALQTDLLLAAGYIEQQSDDNDITQTLGAVATRPIAA